MFNLQEQNNESDKNTIINLCKCIVDREVACKSIHLGKKEEGKFRPVKVVFADAIVKNSFMKNLNKLKNPRNQFQNLSIRHGMTVGDEKMKNCCKILQMKKTIHQTNIQKTTYL